MAQALDRLQSADVGLATEQAMQRRGTVESLANLGRRNQNLIRRQLGFITSLEQREMDPVVAGQPVRARPPGHPDAAQRGLACWCWWEPRRPRRGLHRVPVADVIRAAVSEVEEYRRVSLRRVDVALVSGTAAGSIAHLFSELIENGLLFSPPDSEVEIQGRGIGDGYLIAVVDQGVGMSADELRMANSRLSGEGDFIATPTRFLGPFRRRPAGPRERCPGRAAAVAVAGITARVTLPASLLVTQPAVESGPAGPATARHSITLPDDGPVDMTAYEMSPGEAPTGGFPTPSGQRRLSVPSLSLVDDPAWPQDDEADGVVATVTAVTDLTDDSTVAVEATGELPAVSEDWADEQPVEGDAPTTSIAPVRAAAPLSVSYTPPPVAAASAPERVLATNGVTYGARDSGEQVRSEGSIFTVGTPSPEAVARTRNGLVKRVPRAARPGAPDEAPPVAGNPYNRVAPEPTVGYPSLLNDSPAEVRSRLMAFRDGVRRAQSETGRDENGRDENGDATSVGSDQVPGTQEWA